MALKTSIFIIALAQEDAMKRKGGGGDKKREGECVCTVDHGAPEYQDPRHAAWPYVKLWNEKSYTQGYVNNSGKLEPITWGTAAHTEP